MATISIIQSDSPNHKLINGVFGVHDGERFHIASSLQRIYLLSLQNSMPIEAANVFSIDVADEHKNAIEANLVSMLSQHWDEIYAGRGMSIAGPLESMLRAEQQQVKSHCDAIISELGVQAPADTSVLLRACVLHNNDLEYSEQAAPSVNVAVGNLLGSVDAAQIHEAESGGLAEDVDSAANAGFTHINVSLDRSYEVNIRMNLPLYGSEQARTVFVEQMLPALVGNGLCDHIPVRAESYQEVNLDAEYPRMGYV